MPEPGFTLPYDVLIIDDQIGDMSWGEVTKLRLEEYEFSAKHVSTIEDAYSEISQANYDIIIIDLDLQSPKTGADLQIELRNKGLRQPVILVTGVRDFLSAPLSDYADALALGPVSFYDKRSKVDFIGVVREVSNRVDPVRRVLRLMKEAGLGDQTFKVDDKEYTVEEILASSLAGDDLVRTLRESLYALVLELHSNVAQRR